MMRAITYLQLTSILYEEYLAKKQEIESFKSDYKDHVELQNMYKEYQEHVANLRSQFKVIEGGKKDDDGIQN